MTDIARIYPAYRYRNARAAIDWLVNTIGFREHMVHEEGGVVVHAELAYGASILMLGQARDDAFAARVGEPGGDNGKTLYLAVHDVDGLFDRVVASGATIEEGLTERDYGSREFQCRDPEGNLWCFGTYAPVPE